MNPLDKNSQRITKVDKTVAYNLHYKDINVPVSKKDYSKIEKKNNVCINVFCYENDLVYPVHISKWTFDDCIDLPINDKNNSLYVYIKGFTDLCLIRKT